MFKATLIRGITALLFTILITASTASAQNLLVNPGFEDGPAPAGGAGPGWFSFGNVFTETVFPLSGSNSCKMFGNFSGGFDVTGIVQSFPCAPGEDYRLSSNAFYTGDDPMIGSGAVDSNWVVQKIAFFDAGAVEIAAAAVESTILDGTFAANTWHAAAPIIATAPAGAVTVEALILYLQPFNDGGAAFIDDVVFENISPVSNEDATFGAIKQLFN